METGAAVNDRMLRACFAAAAKGAPSHAYIIEGEDERILRDLSDHFIQLLLCETNDACGKCPSCRFLAEGGHPDLVRVKPEKPGIIRVDDIRDGLVGDMSIRPYRSRYKIYVVEHAEWMNVQAQNALLKTLEEPPSYGVILLLSCNTEALLPTIISRSVRLKAMRGGHGWERIPEEERYRLARIFTGIRGADTAGIHNAAEQLAADDFVPDQVLGGLRTWIRDIMALKLSGAEDRIVIREALPALRSCAKDYTWKQINAILDMTDTAEGRISSGVNMAWQYELLLARMR